MKAFVMCAGAGTRLRPLTYAVPKPMITVANKPVLENTIELLKRHGIKDIVVNLHAHPDIIKNYFDNGKKCGVKLTYSFEPQLLGTAGGIRKMQEHFHDTFVVMSGDGLVDIDLREVVRFHKAKKALATIVLKPLDVRFEYGVVFSDSRNRITKFVEKPSWKDAFESRVNTGIYILEPKIFSYISEQEPCDFGNDIWPMLVRKKAPVYAFETKGYWCDIGNLTEYRRAQRDVMEQHLRFSIHGKCIKKSVWVDTGAHINETVAIDSPCVIGAHTHIEGGVIIGSHTVIGNNCFIDVGAELHNCILWDNVFINKGVKLSNCIIGKNARVSEDIYIHEGTVLNINQ